MLEAGLLGKGICQAGGSPQLPQSTYSGRPPAGRDHFGVQGPSPVSIATPPLPQLGPQGRWGGALRKGSRGWEGAAGPTWDLTTGREAFLFHVAAGVQGQSSVPPGAGSELAVALALRNPPLPSSPLPAT